MRRLGQLRDVLTNLTACGLAPVLLCRATAEGRCSASWHDVCGRQAGKRPLRRGYTKYPVAPPTIDDLMAITRRVWPVNVGIVTGHGFVAVEGDSPEADAEVSRLGGSALTKTPTRAARPGRGRAWIFRTPQELVLRNRSKLGASRRIDVRGKSGLLVVPPSRHASEHRYVWHVAPWDHEPIAIPEDLLTLITSNEIARVTAPGAPSPTSAIGVSSRVSFLLDAHLEVARLWSGEGKERGDDSASGYDFSFAISLLRHHVPVDEVAAAIAARPGAHRREMKYGWLTATNASAALTKRSRSGR